MVGMEAISGEAAAGVGVARRNRDRERLPRIERSVVAGERWDGLVEAAPR
jgi:hypothetical protein